MFHRPAYNLSDRFTHHNLGMIQAAARCLFPSFYVPANVFPLFLFIFCYNYHISDHKLQRLLHAPNFFRSRRSMRRQTLINPVLRQVIYNLAFAWLIYAKLTHTVRGINKNIYLVRLTDLGQALKTIDLITPIVFFLYTVKSQVLTPNLALLCYVHNIFVSVICMSFVTRLCKLRDKYKLRERKLSANFMSCCATSSTLDLIVVPDPLAKS